MWRSRSSLPTPTGAPRSLALLALAGALLVGPPTASAMSDGNLVVNGDAERPVGSEWTAVQGLGLESYVYNSVIPANVLIGGGSYDGGTAALHPRGAGIDPPPPSDPDVTINEQRIALSAEDAEAIATGTVQARFSAHVGGSTDQGDRIEAVAEWRDAADQPLLTQLLPAVTNAERGNQSGALLRVDQQPVPAGARSVVVRLTGTRVVAPMHNGYVDDVELQLIGIPRVEKAFAPQVAVAGEPFRLTYTVRNTGELGAKPPWSFADVLPEGIRVAPVSRAATDCPTARFAVTERRVSVAGGIAAGQATCTASLDVVAAPGRYATGAKQLEDVSGLRVGSFSTGSVLVEEAGPGTGVPEPPQDPGPVALPPIEIPPFVAPPPPPPTPAPVPTPPVDPWLPSVVRPALRATLQAPGGGVRDVGDRVTLRLRVANPTSADASRVRACVALPSALRAVAADERTRGKRTARRVARSRSTTRPCWTVATLAGDAGWSTTLDVRVVRAAGTTVRPRLTVTSPDGVARATSTAKLRVAGEETDEDSDARRR